MNFTNNNLGNCFTNQAYANVFANILSHLEIERDLRSLSMTNKLNNTNNPITKINASHYLNSHHIPNTLDSRVINGFKDRLNILSHKKLSFQEALQKIINILPTTKNGEASQDKIEKIVLKECIFDEALAVTLHPLANTLKTLFLDNVVFHDSALKSLEKFSSLEELSLSNFSFDSFPTNFYPKTLLQLTISSCKNLIDGPYLPEDSHLQKLTISNCPKLTEVATNLHGPLKELKISNCSSLVRLPNLETLNFLEKIEISTCSILSTRNLPKSIKELIVSNCSYLELPDITKTPLLEILTIDNCSLTYLVFKNLKGSLRELKISNCPNFFGIPCIDGLQSLEKFEFHTCINVEELPESLPASLKEINFSGCTSLTKGPDFKYTPFLEKIETYGCINMTLGPKNVPTTAQITKFKRR